MRSFLKNGVKYALSEESPCKVIEKYQISIIKIETSKAKTQVGTRTFFDNTFLYF
jgi:hypothetical protein